MAYHFAAILFVLFASPTLMAIDELPDLGGPAGGGQPGGNKDFPPFTRPDVPESVTQDIVAPIDGQYDIGEEIDVTWLVEAQGNYPTNTKLPLLIRIGHDYKVKNAMTGVEETRWRHLKSIIPDVGFAAGVYTPKKPADFNLMPVLTDIEKQRIKPVFKFSEVSAFSTTGWEARDDYQVFFAEKKTLSGGEMPAILGTIGSFKILP